jgi:hypothetical protein
MSDPAVWRSKDGRTVKITDMSDRHLANAIRVLTVDGAPVSRSGKQRLLLLRDEQHRRQEAGISVPDTPQQARTASLFQTDLGGPATFTASGQAAGTSLHMRPLFDAVPEGDLLLAIEFGEKQFLPIALQPASAVAFAVAILDQYRAQESHQQIARVQEREVPALADDEVW